MTVWVVLTALFLIAGTGISHAAEDADEAPVMQLPGLGEPDTVRTNLWLTEALMGEIVNATAASMPPAPGAVLLKNLGGRDMDELFGVVAQGILAERGYDLFVVARDSSVQAPVDFVYSFNVIGVDLTYPEIGRTLGIWRRWISRDVSVTTSVEISTGTAGQLLFKANVERRFSDRVDNGDFDDVESDLYSFTTAETASSGWQNRMEEIVVLGTLVGLIAIYFANTGN